MALAATAVLSNAAYLVLKSRSKQGLALAAAICAKWQPAYFLLVSIEKIVFLALLITEKVAAGSCGFSPYQRGHFFATELLVTVALLLFSLSAICCDYDSDCSPAMRRGTYSACVVCLVSDMACSFIWGYSTESTGDQLTLGPFRLHLTIQLTSCVTSQAVIMLHLLYVSCRSRGGRGWVYASLRFVLVKQRGTVGLSFFPMTRHISSSNHAFEDVHAGEASARGRSNVFVRLRHRLLQFRRQRLHASRVFAIPCVESDGNLGTALLTSGLQQEGRGGGLVSSGLQQGGGGGLQLSRPLFRIDGFFPGVMIRFADLHEKLYVCAVFAVVVTNLVTSVLLPSDTTLLVLNLAVFYCTLGFFACKRHNIDSAAAKHVAASFKFLCIVLLFLLFFALQLRLACLRKASPQIVCAVLVFALNILLVLLADCSPNLSTTAQSAISVRLRARVIAI